jgi:DNA-binding transcriptional regulator YhcF (GntR family)
VNADELPLAIDRDAEVPVGVQLAWTLRARIEHGTARAGEKLPGLREVADATGLNVNTVRAVYQRLDQEGLIESRQGSGTFVSGKARAHASARTIAANAAREARETGVDPRAVAAALYVTPDAAPDGAREAGARRRDLRSQIAVLERAIGELESEHPGVAPAPARAPRADGPALLSVGDLEHVWVALVRRLVSVQIAIDEHVAGKARSTRTRPERSRAKVAAAAPTRASAGKRRAVGARDDTTSKAALRDSPATPKRAPRASRAVRPAPA